jgi:hypothetical protein
LGGLTQTVPCAFDDSTNCHSLVSTVNTLQWACGNPAGRVYTPPGTSIMSLIELYISVVIFASPDALVKSGNEVISILQSRFPDDE